MTELSDNTEKKSKQKFVQPESTFTLLVYFQNGYTQGMKFHSHKQEKRKFNGVEITDHRYALNRLVYLIEERFKGTYKTAIIYYNPTKTQIIQYSYGSLKHKEIGKWTYATNGDVLFNTRVISEKDLEEIQDKKVQADKEMNYKF